jgi:hypothetical protein
MLGGASAAWPTQAPHAPSTTLRVVPSPAPFHCAGADKLSRRRQPLLLKARNSLAHIRAGPIRCASLAAAGAGRRAPLPGTRAVARPQAAAACRVSSSFAFSQDSTDAGGKTRAGRPATVAMIRCRAAGSPRTRLRAPPVCRPASGASRTTRAGSISPSAVFSAYVSPFLHPRRSLLLLPRARGEGRDEGAFPLGLELQRSDSRRGPLTLASLDLSPHAGRGENKNSFSRRIRSLVIARSEATKQSRARPQNWIASLRSQ